MRTLEHTTDLDASCEAVWAGLLDLSSWPAWNVVRPDPAQPPTEGARFRLGLTVGSTAVPVGARWVEVIPERSLVWCGGPRGLFHAVHGFALSPTDDGGCRLRHHETFSGALAGPALWVLESTLVARYRQVNDALARHLGQ